MEINPTLNIQSVIRAAVPAAGPPVNSASRDQVAFEHSVALNRGLEETPDVRADAVERAKSLISQSSYPPLEILDRVARLLAINLAPEDP